MSCGGLGYTISIDWGKRGGRGGERRDKCTNCSNGQAPYDCDRCGGSGQIDAQYDRAVFIQNCYSRLNLDLKDWNGSNGAVLQLWRFAREAPIQQWHILPVEQYSPIACIASVFNGKNIDLADGNIREGARIQMWESGNNNPNQLWKFIHQDDRSYAIQSVCSGLFLGLSGYNRENGAVVNLQYWSGELSQRWLIRNIQ